MAREWQETPVSTFCSNPIQQLRKPRLSLGIFDSDDAPSVKFDGVDADCALATNASMVLDRLISLGRAFQFQILTGKFLGLDKNAINLCLRLDFTVQNSIEDGTVQVLLKL